MNFNPYQAPTSAYDGGYHNYGSPSSGAVSDRSVAALRKTRPWVVLIAVITLVGAGFLALGGLALMTKDAGIGVAYLVVTGLYVLPAVALIRYGNAINKLIHGGGAAQLDEALESQASFWQIAGIYALIGAVFMVIAFVLALVAGAALFNAF